MHAGGWLMATGTVRASRRFDAPANQVFDAWVDPSLARLWLFTTPSSQVVCCDLDARPGGLLTIVDRREGEDVEHVGTYEELLRPSRLVFRFAVPKYSAEVTRVTVETAPVEDGGCELSLTHEGVPPEWQQSTADGWRTLLQKLSEVLAARR
jgi:uncharacterized protein YndB with AHSA1/START domain